MPAIHSHGRVSGHSPQGAGEPAPRVLMLDLAPIVPYYTSHLCAALAGTGAARPILASATYQYDADCFARQQVPEVKAPVNLTWKLRRAPGPLRRALKLAEYCANFAGTVWSAAATADAVHVQFLPLASRGLSMETWCLRRLQARGVPVVYTVHNVLPHDSGARYLATYKELYSLADRLICHDAESAARLTREFGIAPGKIDLIAHGPLFEAAAQTPAPAARARLGFGARECVVLWQGIMRPYKGVDLLVEAWREVAAANPNIVLAIVGTGDESLVAALRQQVAEAGLGERIRLDLRFISVEEVALYHDAAEIIVYPYRDITTSGALMTGIVRGKAIVAAALPAFEQILRDGENALLFPRGDRSALAQAVLRLADDEALRRGLGDRLRRASEHLAGWAEIAARTGETYRAAMAARKGQG